jgi:osmotically inducible protein OsmC
MPTRSASATWQGGLKGGTGKFEGESGSMAGAYSFGSRFEMARGSNPEELLAAAEAACFSMALAGNLEKLGKPAESVETQARCTVERVNDAFKITTIALVVRASVPGIEGPAFLEAVEKTRTGCPVSVALKGNVDISVDAKLT